MGFVGLGVFGWVGIAVVMAIMLVLGVFRERGTREAWEEVIERMGLEFETNAETHSDDFRPASGTYRGKRISLTVRLRIEEAGASKRRMSGMRRNHAVHKYSTMVEAKLTNAWPCDAPRIETRRLGSRILATLGLGIGDFGVGDRRFDRRYRLEERPAEEFEALLRGDEVSKALSKLASKARSVRIEEGWIRIEWRGRVADPDRLLRRIHTFLEHVEAIDRVVGREGSSTPIPGGGSTGEELGRLQEWAANQK